MLALVAAVTRARAADEPHGETLGEVVVTAPPVEQEPAPRDPTAFGTVIDTRSAPTEVVTLDEALADTVGVQVRRFGGLGDLATVSIRGFSAGQVQVYLDGVPLSRADNETVNLADLPIDAVERIEVYRGATPLAFAQAGPGGVVNVVTRRPGATPLTAASAAYGSFTTRRVDAARSERRGPWEYLAFAHYLGSAGDFSFVNDHATPDPADDVTERRLNNDFDLGDLTARVGFRPGDGPLHATLTSDTFVRASGVPGLGVAQARDARLGTFRQLAHLDLDLVPRTPIPLEASGGAYVLYERQAFSDPRGEIFAATDRVDRSTATGAQLLLRGALGAHHLPGLFLAAGHEGFATDDRLEPAASPPDRTRLRATVAAEDEILTLGERLAIVPGVRWEVFRDDFPGTPGLPAAIRAGGVRVEDFVSPRLGVRATPLPGVTLLGNLGRYARVPNLNELFGDSGAIIGNPTLRPEVAFNRDVGVRLALPARGPLARAGLEYAYFDTRIDDLIVLVQQSQGIVRPDNVTAASVRGHEVAARARLWSRVGLAANYTHQDARDDGDVRVLHGNRLPGRPADEAFAQVDLAWAPDRPLPLGAPAARLWPGRVFYQASVIGPNFLDRANERRVPSRVLHDVGVEVRLPLGGVRVGLEVKNAGDDRTQDVLGFPLPGRAVFATVSWGFARERDDAGH